MWSLNAINTRYIQNTWTNIIKLKGHQVSEDYELKYSWDIQCIIRQQEQAGDAEQRLDEALNQKLEVNSVQFRYLYSHSFETIKLALITIFIHDDTMFIPEIKFAEK